MTTALAPSSSSLALLPPDFFGLNGSKKVNAILSLPDPAGFVQSLREDEFYLLVRDIGPSDSMELLGMSTPEQRVALFDFDAWDRDELVPTAFDGWLDILREAGHDLAVETVRSLDPELLVSYLLKSVVAIFDRTEEDAIRDFPGEYEQLLSPDNDFTFMIDPEEADAPAHVRRLLTLLWQGDDYEAARAIIFSARAGLTAEQTELAYGFRAGRLADLGFPDAETAWQLYAPVAPAAVRQRLLEASPVATPVDPALHVALMWSGQPGSFLNAALQEAGSPERFLVDFGFAVNHAAVAAPHGVSQLDPERLAPLAQRVHGTVSLGLEWLSEGQVARAAELIRAGAGPLELHQVGHALAMGLAKRAAPLGRKTRGLLAAEDQALIDALGTRPSPSTQSPGETLSRPFRTLADVAEAERRLAALERLVAAFEGVFGFDRATFDAHVFAGLDPQDKPFITLTSLAATLVAHVALDQAPTFEPLGGGELSAVRDALPALGPRLSALRQRLPGADAALDAGEAALREALGEVQGRVDPRFLEGALLVRA